METPTPTVAAGSVEELSERIAALVGERQALRATLAPPEALEANRRQILELQQRLSSALVARYRPAGG